jgi:protein gp37
MSEETDIQWCDSTSNPIMGCGGCELFPSPGEILLKLDAAIREHAPPWEDGRARNLFKALIEAAYLAIEQPGHGHRNTITTTNLWHLRHQFEEAVRVSAGHDAAEAARGAIARAMTCYAAKLHSRWGASLLNPSSKGNAGYAETFEQLRLYPGRVREASRWSDLLGTKDPTRPWNDELPRLIFVSDMGDAFSRRSDFEFLREEVIKPVTSAEGRRHLWLWLTKRPELMAEFAGELDGGLPENVCAMTTVTGPGQLDRIDHLRKVRAAVRGLSLEPLWERIDPDRLNLEGIDWVIVGGESGSAVGDTRPFPIEWAEEVRDHCHKQGVAFFLKQVGRRPTRAGELVHLKDESGGDWDEWPDEALRVREFPRYFHDYRSNEIGATGPRRKPPTQTKKKTRTMKTLDKPDPLTPDEQKDFTRLDKIVGKFARDMIPAAEALYQIRNRRLYLARHATFEDYCQEVHGMSRGYANRLIRAGRIQAEMVPIVTKMGLPEPSNEAQIRELARLKTTEEQVEIYQAAVALATDSDGKVNVTARALAEVIDQRKKTDGDTKESAPTPSPKQRIAQARSLVEELESQFKDDEKVRLVLARFRELLEG